MKLHPRFGKRVKPIFPPDRSSMCRAGPKKHGQGYPGLLIAALCLILAYSASAAPQCKDKPNPIASVRPSTFGSAKNASAIKVQSTISQAAALYTGQAAQQHVKTLMVYTTHVPELRGKTIEEA